MQSSHDEKLENSLAETMAMQATINPNIQAVLERFANQLNDVVLKKIVSELEKVEGKLESLASPYKESVSYLAQEHSDAGRNWLGIMRGNTKDKIEKDPQMLLSLVKQFQANLLKKPTSVEDFIQKIKAMTDTSFCFVDLFPKSEKSPNFEMMNACIRPSEDELDVRLQRNLDRRFKQGKPKGSFDTYALTQGRGQGPEDLVSEQTATDKAFLSGKAFFSEVSKKEFIKGLVQKYDEAYEDKDAANIVKIIIEMNKQKIPLDPKNRKTIDESLVPMVEEFDRFAANNKDTVANIANVIAKMNRYHIPLDPKERKPLEEYSKPTTIEKISASSVKEPPSLIAGPAGTMARCLVALSELGAFYKDKQHNVDFDNLIIMSNCLLAASVHGSHHSFLECVETYNRTVDAFTIQAMDQNKPELARSYATNQFPVLNIKREDYLLFIHPSYRDEVRANVNAALESKSESTNKLR